MDYIYVKPCGLFAASFFAHHDSNDGLLWTYLWMHNTFLTHLRIEYWQSKIGYLEFRAIIQNLERVRVTFFLH